MKRLHTFFVYALIDKDMKLIANTGIQLFSVPFEVNLEKSFKMYFHEWFDTEEQSKKIEIAHYFSDSDVWVKKHHLFELGCAPDGIVNGSWEEISSDEDFDSDSIIDVYTEDAIDSGCFDISAGKIKPCDWEKFENRWYPMPFFGLNGRRSEFGPTNWCRFRLIPRQISSRNRSYDLLLAFDTRSLFEYDGDGENLCETPVFSNATEQEKVFSLCRDEYNLISYFSETFNCDWVDKYVLKSYYGVDNINDLKRISGPRLMYMAQYIFLIRYIKQFANIDDVVLISDYGVPVGNVDLVIDVGNSRTCAVLFDNGDFTKSTPLELQNFTLPVKNGKLNKTRDSFDMRLAFRKAEFGGDFGIVNSRQFVYPSVMRLGVEADNLIHRATNTNSGTERTSTFSSPKRYLWDFRPQKHEWEFVRLEGEELVPFYIDGISEQLEIDGSLNFDGNGGLLMHYSRKSLMMLAFLEILAQAKMQINSSAQRSYWGNDLLPRKIGRIIITCPTAMSKVEQVALRRCAEDASIILERFYNGQYCEEVDEAEMRKIVKVIPSAKKLSLKDERTEWIYDEATAAQFVFMYAEIKERYNNDFRKYFELYGKKRNDLEGYDKKSLTVGSVDIGAGTTDVMIAAYKYSDGSECILTPVPLFWESFYVAGDDMLKEIIHQLVIEGPLSPIEKAIRENGGEPVKYLQPFLGTDNGVDVKKRQLRSDFNMQVSVPVASKYLELLKEDVIDSKSIGFEELFGDNKPTAAVMEYFRNHFGFGLETIVWTYERKQVASIVKKTFDSLLGKISSLFSLYKCDIVLVSGRPTSLKPLTDLFLDYYAISPNRLKTMNDYRVGRWYPQDVRYPFIDANGRFINPKSIVTTGAMIGQIAGNGGINGFSLDLSELRRRLLPTTNYFGKLDAKLNYIGTFISPDKNTAEFNVSSIPFRIGVRQKDCQSYPSRPFYMFSFNDYKLEDRVRGRFDDDIDDGTIFRAIEDEKEKIRSKMPLKVVVSRDFNDDLEHLNLEEITDREGNAINKSFMLLQVQSLSEEEDFWLDSGLFSLNVEK